MDAPKHPAHALNLADWIPQSYPDDTYTFMGMGADYTWTFNIVSCVDADITINEPCFNGIFMISADAPAHPAAISDDCFACDDIECLEGTKPDYCCAICG